MLVQKTRASISVISMWPLRLHPRSRPGRCATSECNSESSAHQCRQDCFRLRPGLALSSFDAMSMPVRATITAARSSSVGSGPDAEVEIFCEICCPLGGGSAFILLFFLGDFSLRHFRPQSASMSSLRVQTAPNPFRQESSSALQSRSGQQCARSSCHQRSWGRVVAQQLNSG